MDTPVLVTTAVAPPAGIPHLAMTNPARRLLATRSALYYLAMQGVTEIVVADATNQTPIPPEEARLFADMGVRLEQIAYAQDVEEVVRRGKGYGEGALMRHALDQSQILAAHDRFFKLSSKVVCRNLPQIGQMAGEMGARNLFWRWADPGALFRPAIDARFYLTAKEFALQVLVPSYLASDDGVKAAEGYMYDNIARNLRAATSLRPRISGFCGGADAPYFDEDLGFLDDRFPCWTD
jgi:hypothetical protein